VKIRFIRSVVAALILIIFFNCSTDSPPVSFTADMVQNVNNRRIEGRIFVKGNKYRMDIKEGEEELSILVDRESGKQQVLVHSERNAHEHLNTSPKSLSNNPFEYFNHLLENNSSRKGNIEVINGNKCRKTEVFRKDKKLATAWISDNLDWPVKIKTEFKPKKDVDLSNIKEETLDDSLFRVPEDYRFSPLPETKKEKSDIEDKSEQTSDTNKTRENILKKLEEMGIKRENEEGTIKIWMFATTFLNRLLPGWEFFRIVREKEMEDSTSSVGIPVAKAVVSGDGKTLYILNSPKTDMLLADGLEIFQNQKINPNSEKDVEVFGRALTILYFEGSSINDVEYLGDGKWAVFPRTDEGRFIVEVNDGGEITGLSYKR